MASKDVAPILAKEFVGLRIDADRMTGGKALMKRYAGKESVGIPWIAFLDGDGNALINSEAPPPTGNVGFPAKAEEYAHFKTMLEKVKRHLSDEDIAALMKSLEEANKKTT